MLTLLSPLQFDTVADCVEIRNIILKSYTVYTEVGDCGFVRLAVYAFLCACMRCLCVCRNIHGCNAVAAALSGSLQVNCAVHVV